MEELSVAQAGLQGEGIFYNFHSVLVVTRGLSHACSHSSELLGIA
jgi:hypothetical protein